MITVLLDTFNGKAYVLDRAEYLKKKQRNNPEAEEYKTKLMDSTDIQETEHYDVQAAQQTKARHDKEQNERQRRRMAQRTSLHQDHMHTTLDFSYVIWNCMELHRIASIGVAVVTEQILCSVDPIQLYTVLIPTSPTTSPVQVQHVSPNEV